MISVLVSLVEHDNSFIPPGQRHSICAKCHGSQCIDLARPKENFKQKNLYDVQKKTPVFVIVLCKIMKTKIWHLFHQGST